jgi:purine-cytosine permease-like protein
MIETLLLLLNIWTTNDSNFFSSQKVIQTLGVKKQYTFLILPLLNGFLAITFQDDLFSLIGSWLKLMGWMAIPLTLFWWYIVVKGIQIK